MLARIVIPRERMFEFTYNPKTFFEGFVGDIWIDDNSGDLFIRNEHALCFEGDPEVVRPVITRIMTWLHTGVLVA